VDAAAGYGHDTFQEMINFEFLSPSLIKFGPGVFNHLGELLNGMGKKTLVVLGSGSLRASGAVERLLKQLDEIRIDYCFYEGISAEPEIETADKGVLLAREYGCDLVIGLGGGSVIDTAKAIAGLATHEGSVMDYLEGVGKGLIINRPSLPCVAIPTTAGTGTEVTKNAVISSRNGRFKKSLRSPYLIPKIALIDPALTLTLPPNWTAWGGMDVLTQLIESYVSKKAQPIPEALALYGIPLVANNLLPAYKTGTDLGAREKMALAALLSGLALANSGLGAAHGLASALGAYCPLPHGLACAMLLPAVMELNIESNIEKFARIGEALTGSRDYKSPSQAAGAGIRFVRELLSSLDISSNLRNYGIEPDMVQLLVTASFGSSMSGNPKDLSTDDLTTLLQKLL
jgi:alcohol dehydrogenase class IV